MESFDSETTRNFTALISSFCEVVKQQQDYYKALCMLNATTLLITIAFADKFVQIPKSKPLIMIPFAFFTLSLLASLYMMRIFGDLHAYFMGFQLSVLGTIATQGKDLQTVESEMKSLRQRLQNLGAKANKLQGPALWLYFGGIITLIIFAIHNLVPAKWPYFLGILLLILLAVIFLGKLRSKKKERQAEASVPGPKPPTTSIK